MTIDNPLSAENRSEYMLRLRPYQEECLIAVRDAILNKGVKRPAVVLPTGSGKTVIFSHLCNQWRDLVTYGHVSGRVLILVHRDELIRQTVKKLAAVAPGLRVGVVKAQENDHEDRDVIVASVQTVSKLYRLDQITASGPVGLVIVDECHHAAAESYVSVLNALGCFNDESPTAAVGFTATLVRADKKSLGDVWQDVVYQRDILDMIADHGHGDSPCHPLYCKGGYLVDVKGKMITVDGFSLSEVAMRGGDYAIGSLSEALLSADAPKFAADAYVEHASKLPGIVFTPSVETARAFTDEFSARGIPTACVWGDMGDDARRAALKGAHDGRTQVLVNCMVLTEGFDWPRAEAVMIARPTTSAALFVQMVGRVLRRYPGKESALVLDIVGATKVHRLATLADLTSQRIQEMREGESLLEAVAREHLALSSSLVDYARGYEDVDLFQRSHAAWLQTTKGVWFVATKSYLFFIWPGSEPGLYRLGKRPIRSKGGTWLKEDVTLDLAMSWGSQLALSEDSMMNVVSKKASWRRTRPSEKMVAYARRLGLGEVVEMNADIRQGELSDMISVKQASGILDRAVR